MAGKKEDTAPEMLEGQGVDEAPEDGAVTLSKKQFDDLMKRIEKVEKSAKSADQKTGSAGPPPSPVSGIAENEKRMQELVTVELFKDNGKYRDDVFVAVNGKGYLIQRGIPVQVPRCVKEILDSMKMQDMYAAKYSEALTAEYERTVGKD